MNKRVLKLAFPNIISNITVPLLGMADIAVLGHVDEASNLIGAIAIGGMIFGFIYMTMSFLRGSTTGLTAQAFGQKNKMEIQAIFVRASVLALLLALTILLLHKPLEWLAFNVLDGEAEVEQYAREYFNIRIWAAPATLMLYVFNGWFIGMQNAKAPMYIAVFGNIINVSLNYFFVFVLDMKAEGVALGTLIAQYLSVFLAVAFMYSWFKPYLKNLKIKSNLAKEKLFELLSMNRDLFIRSLVLIFVLSFFTASSASLSTEILAVNSILFQFFLFFSFFMDGFAYASEALTGRYIGERNLSKLKSAIRSTFLWGIILSIPFTLLYLFGNEFILRILTSDEGIIALAQEYMIWIVLIPILTFTSFLWDGVYTGATAIIEIRNSMLISGLVIFLPAYYLLLPVFNSHALWLAFSLFMFSRGFWMSLWYKKAVLSKIPTELAEQLSPPEQCQKQNRQK